MTFTADQEAKLREIIREEIAANWLAISPVFADEPTTAVQMALDHEERLAPVREEVLRALARQRSDRFKDSF